MSEAIEGFALQRELLNGVSRTFALTIPALPERLERIVGNAYLLCRIADTIEDATDLDPEDTRLFVEQFINLVSNKGDAREFARRLSQHLAPSASPEERQLIRATDDVLAITHQFSADAQRAVRECVKVMSRGMVHFQRRKSVHGLENLIEHSEYCYTVAGCVGEMLTRLFIDEMPQLRAQEERLMSLAVSFGQVLQMTNILKDFWEDRERGACWLPREVFAEEGIDLAEVQPGDSGFAAAYTRLIGLARFHAQQSLIYTLLLPRREVGVRNFCLWALFMALLTLKKLANNPDFASGSEVKISRRAVKNTVFWCRLTARENALVNATFQLLARGLPKVQDRDLTASWKPASTVEQTEGVQ